MRKLTLLFLSICVIFAVSCSSGFDPEVSSKSQSGGDSAVGGNSLEDLIPINASGSTGDMKVIKAFIKKHDGTYYEGKSIEYLFIGWNGTIGVPESERDRQVAYLLPQVFLPSANKLQTSNYNRGEIRVLNMSEDGKEMEAYTSYIIEKVSDNVLIQNKGIGGRIPALAQYKGTYKSVARDNKVENYVAIDENGNIYFHDSEVSILGGRADISGGKLTIWENYKENGKSAHRKVVFKFDQGVYRRYDASGKDLGYKLVSRTKK